MSDDTARRMIEALEPWLDPPNATLFIATALRALAEAGPSAGMSAKGFCVSEAEHDPAAVFRAMLAQLIAEVEQEGKERR